MKQPLSPVTGLSHLQLRVTDLAASQSWYESVLGLVSLSSGDNYVALRHPPSGVVLVLSEWEGGSRHGEESAMDHVAFGVTDAASLEDWAAHLSSTGIDHPGIVLELGRPSLQLRDPDGVAVELVAPAPGGARGDLPE